MKPKRILVADDSQIFAAAVSEVLAADPDLDVVGVAVDGDKAVTMTQALRPDLVTMDVLMPVVDGLTAVERIMATCPTPVLVLSSDPRGRGGELSFEALRRGALDCMAKPEQWPVPQAQRHALVQRVRLLASVPVVRHIQANRHRWRPLPPPAPAATARVDVVGIVASTGGPGALAEIFGGLGDAVPVPIVVVQHLAAGFAAGLCRWLTRVCPLTVRQAEHGAELEPGVVHVAPPGRHLQVGVTRRIRLDEAPPVAGHRPSGTVMLRSLARAYRQRALGAVLTGMGRDGAEGMLALREMGAPTIAQDDATSVVPGMPRAARNLGAVGSVLPLPEIAAAIIGFMEAVRRS